MLKGIPKCISPQLLKVLAEMGHGDTIVLGDAFYPAASNAKRAGGELVRADGITSTELLDAILTLLPLDSTEHPVLIMDKPDSLRDLSTPVWDEYKAIVAKHDKRGDGCVGMLERFAFYDEANKAYAVISTGEEAYFGCLILQKGTK